VYVYPGNGNSSTLLLNLKNENNQSTSKDIYMTKTDLYEEIQQYSDFIQAIFKFLSNLYFKISKLNILASCFIEKIKRLW